MFFFFVLFFLLLSLVFSTIEEEEEAVGHQLLLQSGPRRMFPQRMLWEAQSRSWPALQIITISVLIRVLWLMFDEEGDRLPVVFPTCFYSSFLPLICFS